MSDGLSDNPGFICFGPMEMSSGVSELEQAEGADPNPRDVQTCLRLLVYAGLSNGPAADRTGDEHKKAASFFFTDAVIDAAIAKIHDGSWCAALAERDYKLPGIIAKWEQIAQERPSDNMTYHAPTIQTILKDLKGEA